MIPRDVFEKTLLGFLAPIAPYLEDPTVSEVMINGPHEIFVERKGTISRTDTQFESREALESAMRNLAQYVGRHVDVHRPILEARLPDGSRVQAVFPPAAPDGPFVSIRRFFKEQLTMDKLVEYGSITRDAADFLRLVVAVKQNIIVAGGTGSGKTSLLNALSSFINRNERVVVIEDSRELQLRRPHVVQLESVPPDAKGRGYVSIRDLFKATLRMRPDRIVVGEIRSGEALELIQAMTSGHGGCLSTVHATYPIDTLNRLETMALMSDVQLPLYALRAQLSSAINFIVQTSRLPDGSRCITHITEVRDFNESSGYILEDVFKRKFSDETATLEPTGYIPKCAEAMFALGLKLPGCMYVK
ncbi:MAG: CpaF family protein [Myxococcales bacterium]|nr:CpaF family protein [Myxococcales bacterium]MCB9707403.1 CpaF family protein [Myxococcales bacterium]